MSKEGLLYYLPNRLRRCVEYYQENGYCPEEVCLHRGERILLICNGENLQTGVVCSETEFEQIFLELCQHSFYAHAHTIRQGYISVNGGYRVGVCGSAVEDAQGVANLSQITGLHLRLPRTVQGVSETLYQRLRQSGFSQSVLVCSAPGVGKTTLLRDLARRLAEAPNSKRVCVVDSRREIEYGSFFAGTSIDLLSGYPKAQGMEIAVRTLSPQYVICDEIGNQKDVEAVLHLMHAGAKLVASAHAEKIERLLLREEFALLHQKQVFDLYALIERNGQNRQLKIVPREHFL